MNDAQAPARSSVIVGFALVYIVWGSTYLAIRLAVETIPPLLMAGTRFLIAGSVMYAVVRARTRQRPTLVHWRSAAVVGGFLLLGGNGLVVWAEQHLTSSMTVLLVSTVSLWMVVLNWARREGVRPGALEVMGIALGIGGVAILVGGSRFSGDGGVHAGGVVALLCAALLWALGSIYSRQAPLPRSPFLAVAMEMLAGGALLTAAGLAGGEWSRVDLGRFSTVSLGALAYLIVFGSFVGFTAYIWLLGVSTPAKVSTYAFVNPVIAVFLGCTLGGEPFSVRMLIATVVIIGAVTLITLHRMQAAKEPDPAPQEPRVPHEGDSARVAGKARPARTGVAPALSATTIKPRGSGAGACAAPEVER